MPTIEDLYAKIDEVTATISTEIGEIKTLLQNAGGVPQEAIDRLETVKNNVAGISDAVQQP